MPTPSFEKRLRRDTGKRVAFTYRVSGKKMRNVTAKIQDVEWNASEKSYFLIAKNANGSKKNGSVTVRVSTDRIMRPVRRITK